jgi:hypothetical protein
MFPGFFCGPPLLLAQSVQSTGAPLVWRIISKMILLVHMAYFHANSLLTGLDTTETEIYGRKDDDNIKKQTDIDCHGPKPSFNGSQPPDPTHFSLPTTFKHSFIFEDLNYKIF